MIQRCPECRKPIPLSKVLWGVGKPFVCSRCGTEMVVPKDYWAGLATFLAWYALRPADGDVAKNIALIAMLGLALFFYQGLRLQPQRVTPALRD